MPYTGTTVSASRSGWKRQAIDGKLLSPRFQRDTLGFEAVLFNVFQMPQPVINRNPCRATVSIDDPALALHRNSMTLCVAKIIDVKFAIPKQVI